MGRGSLEQSHWCSASTRTWLGSALGQGQWLVGRMGGCGSVGRRLSLQGQWSGSGSGLGLEFWGLGLGLGLSITFSHRGHIGAQRAEPGGRGRDGGVEAAHGARSARLAQAGRPCDLTEVECEGEQLPQREHLRLQPAEVQAAPRQREGLLRTDHARSVVALPTGVHASERHATSQT